jgi:PST family polysaccharide transporter
MFFDKFLRMSIGLVVGIWLARYLGPKQFGALNFAIAFNSILCSIASLGLDGIIVRDIVRDPDRKYEIIASAFFLKLCSAFIAFVLSLVAIVIMRPDDIQIQWLVAIISAGMIFQTLDIIDLWFQSQLLSKYTVYAKSAVFIALSLVKVLLIVNNAPLMAFAWIALAEVVFGAAALAIAYVISRQYFRYWKLNRSVIKHLLKSSTTLMLSGFAFMIYMRIDQVMLGQICDSREVGIYASALRFSEIWYFIPSVIVASVMPALTEAKIESTEMYYQRLKKLFDVLVRIAYAIALPITIIARPLITHLYGAEFAEAGTVLSIHIWTSLFIFIGIGLSPWIINENKLKFGLFQSLLGAATNIALNLILIPAYGAKGAAIGTLTSQIVATYLILVVTPETRKMFYLESRALLFR